MLSFGTIKIELIMGIKYNFLQSEQITGIIKYDMFKATSLFTA